MAFARTFKTARSSPTGARSPTRSPASTRSRGRSIYSRRNAEVLRRLGQVETLPFGRISRDLEREKARLQSALPDEYELRWANLRAELIARRDALIQRVLEADSSAF